MNIIIENNKDFYHLLNNSDNDDNIDNNNKDINDISQCLLSHLPLEDNYVTLDCNHKFNYLELFNEISKQKMHNSLEIVNLKTNEIKCPYCRTITPKLLPYFKIYNTKLIKGVNFPIKHCFKINECKWKFKNGKNKDTFCGCSAYILNNFQYCQHHHDLNEKQMLKINEKEIIYPENELESKIFKYYKVKFLKNLLKENNCKVSGNKIQLVKRIIENNLLNIDSSNYINFS